MITIRTDKPIALDSPDHIRPFGTALDNSTHAPFNRKLYEIIPAEHVRLLDLGCSGGGFVKSILDDGGFAVGVEGSDYSKLRRRAEWPRIPDRLFTADITAPFALQDREHRLYFNAITAWEFLEHIADEDLDRVFDNIADHVDIRDETALFLGSIATWADVQGGISLHQTVKPRQWWLERLQAAGFRHREDLERHFAEETLRGPRSHQPVPGSFFFAMSLP